MIEAATISLDIVLAFGIKVIAFLIGLAVLIFVHELGHFLIARKCGVVVEKFSIGFGPKIVGYKPGETEYLIAAIPLGGYVKMKGEDPGEELEDTRGSFSAAPVHQRLAIAFGGPLFNILFAILIYIGIFMVGVPTLGTTVGEVRESSPAMEAGLKSGDRIIKIEGREVRYFDQLQDVVHNSPGKNLEFEILRDEKNIISLSITPKSEETLNLFGEKVKLGLIGVAPMARKIYSIENGSPADQAGLKVGDDILFIGDTEIRGYRDLKTAAIDKPGQELTFKILRQGERWDIKVTPEPRKAKGPEGEEITQGYLGLGLTGEMVLEQYSFLGAVKRGLERSWEIVYLISVSIKKLIFGSISAKTIGGPILIFQVYGHQVEQGLNELIQLTALLSINLGLLNLLPIPILDGGHIFFFLIEIIKGKPVSEKNRERAAQVGLFMLLSLMIFAFYNDIVRVIN